MRRAGMVLTAVVSMAALGGCLERRLHITSEPPGALVHLNDVEVGRTPVEVDFRYYGTYDVLVEKEGYEPLRAAKTAEAPVYEWPIIDIVASAWPGRIRNDVRWAFELEPAEDDPDSALRRAREMRDDVAPEPVETEDEQSPSESN